MRYPTDGLGNPCTAKQCLNKLLSDRGIHFGQPPLLFTLRQLGRCSQKETRVEDKKQIVEGLKQLLRGTRAGSGIVDMVLDEDENTVTVLYESGSKRINVSGDSGDRTDMGCDPENIRGLKTVETEHRLRHAGTASCI